MHTNTHTPLTIISGSMMTRIGFNFILHVPKSTFTMEKSFSIVYLWMENSAIMWKVYRIAFFIRSLQLECHLNYSLIIIGCMNGHLVEMSLLAINKTLRTKYHRDIFVFSAEVTNLTKHFYKPSYFMWSNDSIKPETKSKTKKIVKSLAYS